MDSQPGLRRQVKPVEASSASPRRLNSSPLESTGNVSLQPSRGDLANAADGKDTSPSTLPKKVSGQCSTKEAPSVAVSTQPATSPPSAAHLGTPLRSAVVKSETPVAKAPSPKPRVQISIPLSRPASDFVQGSRVKSPTQGRPCPQPSPRLLSDTRSASVNCFSSLPSMDTAAVLLQLSKVEESLSKVGREMRVRELQLEDEANGVPRADDGAATDDVIASSGGSDARSIALDVAARFAHKNRDCVAPVRQVRHPHCEVLVDIIAQNRSRAAAANAALRRICMDSERGLDASLRNEITPYVMPEEVGAAVRTAIASNFDDMVARRRAMSKEYAERLTIWKKRTKQGIDKRSREKRDACKERDRFLFRAIHGEGAVLSLRTSSGRTSTKVLTGVTSGGTPFVNPSAEVDAAVAELEVGGTPGSELIWSRTLADLPVQNASVPPTDCGSVLIEDPVAMYINACAVNPWSRAETVLFLEKFVLFQKDFRRIATFLEHKSTADVIRFYYQNKLRLNLKLISLKRRGLKRVHLMSLAGLRRQSDSGKRSPKLTGVARQPSVTFSPSRSPKRKHSASNGPPSKRPRVPRHEDIVLSSNASSSSMEVGRITARGDDAKDAAEPSLRDEPRDTVKEMSATASPNGVKPEKLTGGAKSGETDTHGIVEGTASEEVETEPEVVGVASEEKVETKKKNVGSTENESKGSPSNVATSSVHDSETNGHVASVAHPESKPSATAGKVSPNLTESKAAKDASKPRAVWTLEERALFHKHYAANGNSWRKVAAIMPSKTMSQVKGYWLKLNAGKDSERHKAKPSSSTSGGHDGASTPHAQAAQAAPPVQSSSGSETPVSVSELPSKSLGPLPTALDPSLASNGERTGSPQHTSDAQKLPNGIGATVEKLEESKPVVPRPGTVSQEMSLVLPVPRDPALSGPADPVSRSGTSSFPKFRSAPSPGGSSFPKPATTPNAISKGPPVVTRPQGLARIPLSSPSPSLSLRSVPSMSPQASGTPRAPGSTRLQDIVKRARAAGFLANSGLSNATGARSTPSVDQPTKLEETDAKK